eukprot:7010722-Heterocapsa_arctica.AAC.1
MSVERPPSILCFTSHALHLIDRVQVAKHALHAAIVIVPVVEVAVDLHVVVVVIPSSYPHRRHPTCNQHFYF